MDLKGLAESAEKLAKEHADQLQGVVGKVADVVDEKTGGKHHDQIEQAEGKVDDYLKEQATHPSPSTGSTT